MLNKKILLVIPFAILTLASCSNSDVTKYKLTLDPNGGSVSQESITVEEGKTASLPVPTKNNKTFIGWYTGWGKLDYKVTDTTVIKENLNLIARWNTYDVTFYNGDNSVFDTETVSFNAKVNEPLESPTISKDKEHPYFDKWDYNFYNLVNSDLSINSIWSDEPCFRTVVNYVSSYDSKKKELHYIVPYKDSYFNKASTEFNSDLSIFSSFLSYATGSAEEVSDYCSSLGFDDIQSFGYDTEKDPNGVCYSFAHRKAADNDLILVSIRGVGYKNEWANNFLVGKEGPHQGFNESSLKIIPSLNTYINKYNTSKFKLLITGYSRGGGVANLLANNLLITKGIYTTDNTYVYTFEAPKGIEIESAVEYKNVFNIINSADLIQAMAPKEYGFARCGIDVDIYSENIDELIKAFDPDFVVEKFKPDLVYYPTEPAYVQHIITRLVSFKTDLGPTICTREEYVDNIQDSLFELVNVAFSLSSESLDDIVSQISGDNMIVKILTILSTDYGIYDFIEPYLIADQISYDEATLKESCRTIKNFIVSGPGAEIVAQYANFPRLIANHMPEIDYILLKNYLSK